MQHVLFDLINRSKNPDIIGMIIKPKIKSGELNKVTSQYCGKLKLETEYTNEKAPRPTAHYGSKVYFKLVSPAEWSAGRISKKTYNRIKDAMAKERNLIKKDLLARVEELKKSTASEEAKKEMALAIKDREEKIAHLKITVSSDIRTFIKRVQKITGSKLLIRKYAKKSSVTPVKVGATSVDKAYADFINGEPIGEYNIVNGEKSLNGIVSITDEGMFVVYKGSDRKNKTSRAIVRLVRKFERSKIKSGIHNPEPTYLTVFDIIGPQRQQQQIMKTIYRIAKDNGRKFFMSEEMVRKFRYLFKFGEKPIKLITLKQNSYQNVAPAGYQSVARNPANPAWRAVNYFVIPKAIEVLSCNEAEKVDEKE